MKLKITTIFTLLICSISKAQDARVTQFESVPMLISPANTGNFDGNIRSTASFHRFSANSVNNNIGNIGIEFKFGDSKKSAIGLNYARSGASQFSMSGDYLSVSASNFFYTDSEKKSAFRVGIQAGFISGNYQISKGSYDHLLDVNSFYYITPAAGTATQNSYSKSYLNWGLGFGYNYKSDNFSFESSLGAYNMLNPRHAINDKDSEIQKRIRFTINNSFTYNFNSLNSIKFSQMSWQEGLYMRQKPSNFGLDSIRISEFIYGIDWKRNGSTPISVGVYSRSFKTASLMLGVNFLKDFTARLSYEVPLNDSYYNVSQIGISLIAIK